MSFESTGTKTAKVNFVKVVLVTLLLVAALLLPAQVITAEEVKKVPISELDIGASVIDETWQWEFRKIIQRQMGTTCNDGPVHTELPIFWVVAAKNHPGYPENSVTLLSYYIIADHCFDSSTNRGSSMGSNHWGNSGQPNARGGLRTFLNNTFYNTFSESFKHAVLPTQVINVDFRNQLRGDFYYTEDYVFVPSHSELGLDLGLSYNLGQTLPFFELDLSCWGLAAQSVSHPYYFDYWLRTPQGRKGDQHVYFINRASQGVQFVPGAHFVGVRPLVNVKGDTLVTAPESGKFSKIIAPYPPPAGWNAVHRLGSENVNPGAYVEFGGKLWRVIGDNYLALWQPEPTRRAFAASGSSDYARSDIRTYLNSIFFTSLGNQKEFVNLTLWDVGGHQNPKEEQVLDRVGLLSAAESGPVFAISDMNDISGAWEWLRTPHSTRAGELLVMPQEGPHQVKRAGDSSGAVRPVIVLTPGLYIASGTGEQINPYTLTDTAQVPVTGLLLSSRSITIPLSYTERLTARILPAGATNKNLTWHSRNPFVAMVDQNGLVRAVGMGSTVVYAEAEDGGLTASCTVTVNVLPDLDVFNPKVDIDPGDIFVPDLSLPNFSDLIVNFNVPVESFSLSKADTNLIVGGSEMLTAIIAPHNATQKVVNWASSNPSVASVDDEGRVTGIAEGTALITASTHQQHGVYTADCLVNVASKRIIVTGVTLEDTNINMGVGSKQLLLASILPADATGQELVWDTDNPAVAQVSAFGEVSAVGPGEAWITATTVEGGYSSRCKVTVTGVSVPVSSVAIDQDNLELLVDQVVTLQPMISPENATNKTVTWASSDPSVVSVNSEGVVTAKSAGSAVVTAETADGGMTAACQIGVVNDNYEVGTGQSSGGFLENIIDNLESNENRSWFTDLLLKILRLFVR